MIRSRFFILTVSSLLVAVATGAEDARAQAGLGAPPEQDGWAPPSLGIRFGWDNKQRDEVLGAQIRLPILPSGEVELMGSGDIIFLRNLKEYQYNIEAVYVLDGRAGGLYGGGGLGLRDTIYPDRVDRQTELGYNLVVGFRLVGLGIFVPQLEYRWTFIEAAPFTYESLSLGLNLALWRPVERR